MGQILMHGVYLPDEGERNCYSGLASNWSILDGAVGTIAEHTSALAGKAPAVHTHTKSDVTDLLNSNFIPSANNSYDLGSSSYQWNNVYSKNYYYNGTAWGLDKANVWSVNQYYTGMVILNSLSDVVEQFRQILPKDVSTSSDALVRFNTLVDSAGHNVVVEASGHWANYVSKSITLTYKNDSTKKGTINFTLESSGHGLFYPESPFECDLGNAYNKWKTLNGVNPGALSLPGTSYTDIKEYITDRNYGANYYTAPGDGYVCVGSMASSLQISNDTLGFSTTGSTGQDGYASAYIPVRTGNTVRIQVKQTSTDYQYFSFYPCAGNV